MKIIFKIIFLILISASLFSCERISQQIDRKINDEVDKKIEESLNKLDSIISKDNLDSIAKKIDSAFKKTKEKIK
jgi:hypothetical protein